MNTNNSTFQPFTKSKRSLFFGESYTKQSSDSKHKKSLREMRNGNKRREWEEL